MSNDSQHKDTYGDFRDFITRDELVRAMILLSGDDERAQPIVDEVYAEANAPFGLAGDVVSALSSLSEDTAERIRLCLGETKAEADARLAEFRARMPDSGSG